MRHAPLFPIAEIGDRVAAMGGAAEGGVPPDSGSPGPSLRISLGDDEEGTRGSVLAEIRYGSSGACEAARSHPVVHLDLPCLSGNPSERWTTDRPVACIERARMRLAMNGGILFGYLAVPEAPGDSLDALVYRGYRGILSEIRALAYPYLLRVWNYFPGINREESGLERYQQFCLGRYRAFSEHFSPVGHADFRRHLPAATAIGTRSGPLQVYFLAGRAAGVHLENPRQVSAYKYPPIYGPKSPSFARATLYRSGERHLFIAGTSSIVGHASRHPGDPRRQAVETLRNIETVIATARSLSADGARPGDPDTGSALLKIYVRHPEHFPVVRAAFAEHLKTPSRCLYLSGDICRANLLVEAEALVADRHVV